MNYIVLDMEWNQPWPGSPSAKKVLPVAIRGEIIQIGAVRVTEDQQVTDEFQVMVRPKYYRRLNRRVRKITSSPHQLRKLSTASCMETPSSRSWVSLMPVSLLTRRFNLR